MPYLYSYDNRRITKFKCKLRLYRRYFKIRSLLKKSLNRHPLLTNSIIYGSFCTISEFSQQTMSKKLATPPEPYDPAAIARFGIYGTVIAGPLLNTWYGTFLDKLVVGKTIKICVKKLLIDQFTFTPALLVIFYITMSAMEGKKDLLEECKQKFIPTFKTSCLFWMPAQFINFMVVPPIMRVAYISVCSFAWINILCYLKRQTVQIDSAEGDFFETNPE